MPLCDILKVVALVPSLPLQKGNFELHQRLLDIMTLLLLTAFDTALKIGLYDAPCVIYNMSSSIMFPITSDPVDALVTTQPTKTFLPNLVGKQFEHISYNNLCQLSNLLWTFICTCCEK